MRRRLRIALITLGLLAVPLAVAPTIASAATAPKAAPQAITPAAGPTAAQLLARAAKGCSVVSKGKLATDEGSPRTVSICKAGAAYVWKADMDIDCDGVRTSKCNEHTDCCFQNQTSFQTSKGRPFQSDLTHYYVIPLPSSVFSYKKAGIKPGSVAAVIFKGKMVYAVFADEGPNSIIGEASYATAVALGINPNPKTGGVDSGVTYIVFAGQVPSPVESNNAITAKGTAAATAWVNS